MLSIDTQVVNQANQQIDIQVSITAPNGSPGIESVTVTAVDTTVLNPGKQTPTGCPGKYSFVVGAIPFAVLPIYIEAIECQAGVDQGQANKIKTSVGPLFREFVPGLNVDCKAPGQNQNNPTCIKLQNQILSLRNTITTQCADAANIKGKRDTAFAVSGALLAASVTTAAIAAACALIPIVGWVLFVVFAAIALTFAIASGVAGAFGVMYQNQLDALIAMMNQERSQLSDLITHLRDVCCTEFITVPQDVPLCN